MIRFIHAPDLRIDSSLRLLERQDGASVEHPRSATLSAMEGLIHAESGSVSVKDRSLGFPMARGWIDEQAGSVPFDAWLRVALPMADRLASWMKASVMERGHVFMRSVRGARHAHA